MKKSFLLSLMAMLLPLTTWAQEKTDLSTATVEFDYAVYAGTATSIPTEYVVIEGTALTRGTDYTVSYSTEKNGSFSSDMKVRHAGTYYAKITAVGESDKCTGETTVEFEIDKAELTLTVGNTTKTYGESDNLTAVYSANYQPGDSKQNVTIDGLKVERVSGFEGENVGSYTITLNATNAHAYFVSGGNKTDYEDYTLIVTSQGSLTINPKSLTLVYEGLDGWTYGDAEDKFDDIKVTGNGYAFDTDNDETVGLNWEITETEVKNAGEYHITAELTKSKNYTLANPETTFEIAKKDLNVTVTSVEKTYGQKDPAITVTSEDWQYNDAETVTVTPVRETGEDVKDGGYKITSVKISSENYTVIYDEESQATLTINPKSLKDDDITIEVAEADKVYQGQQNDFALNSITVKYTGKEVEEVKEDLTKDTDYTFTFTNGVKNAGETVTVTVKAVEKGNYTDENAETTFEIAKAPLKLTANVQEIAFSTSATSILEQISKTVSDVTISDGELKAGDVLADTDLEFSINPEVSVTIGENENCIVVKVKDDSDIAKNYKVEYGDNATLTVNASGSDVNSITIGRDIANTKQLLEAYNGYEAKKPDGSFISGGFTVYIKENRTINKDTWYAMVLPFDISVRDFSKAMGYAIVDMPDENNTEAGVISFKLHMGDIPANKLFVFKTDQNRNLNTSEGKLGFKLQGNSGTDNVPLIGGGNTVIKFDPDYYYTDPAGNEYHGVYETVDIQGKYGYWYLAENKFWHAGVRTTTTNIYTLQGYVIAKAGSEARILVEEPDGSTTTLNAVTIDTLNTGDSWYTIGGVKLDGEPTQKGVYIHNGKKIVIK